MPAPVHAVITAKGEQTKYDVVAHFDCNSSLQKGMSQANVKYINQCLPNLPQM